LEYQNPLKKSNVAPKAVLIARSRNLPKRGHHHYLPNAVKPSRNGKLYFSASYPPQAKCLRG
jgi:hypothetical protein